jgi:4-hydroxy-3-methylbut-2-en-1-yl diphosphate reductase
MTEIILTEPRGFCSGVSRAIRIVEDALNNHKKVYVRHHIVHNERVVTDLENKGAIFVEEVNEVPEGKVCIFSAHGVSLDIVKKAEKRNLIIIDATCPFVKKVHKEAEQFHNRGYTIIYIGKKGHPETVGTQGYAPLIIIRTQEDVEALDISGKICVLCQTTISVEHTKEIITALKKKYPHIELPKKEDICYATTERQHAVKKIAEKVELFIIVGSNHSSNSNELVNCAKQKGIPAYLVPSPDKLNKKWITNAKKIGMSSGASVPEDLFLEVVKKVNTMIKKD